MIKNKLVTAALIGTTFLAGVGLVNVARRNVTPGETVVEVVDGDTFFIQNRQPIRLKGLDAPELGNCYSDQAKKELEKLVLNKKVTLKEPQVDAYKRILALVYLGGVSINEYLIKNGFAFFKSANTTELANFQEASDYARAHKAGIFGPECYQINPPDPKCVIKGNFDDNSDKKVYFLPGCSYYDATVIMKFRGEQWFCSEAEALSAGFEKSKYCK